MPDAVGALDAAAVCEWARAAYASLDAHRTEIDLLNVFPVHDSDTGTNLATTMSAALRAVEGGTGDAVAALAALARGAVLGASGNSGNIVAQLLRGIAEAANDAGTCDAHALRAGLRRGAAEARAAVADPVEGTILTVAAAAADAVPDDAATPAQVAGIALAAADEALGRTPEQLPALARAGVVDAGGQGLVLILEALVRSIGVDTISIAPVQSPETVPHQHAAGGGAFEVQYLLDTDAGGAEGAAHSLRSALARLGDSVVVIGTGDGTLSIHVHTDDAGAAVEAGIACGRPYRISVSPLIVTSPHGAKPSAVVAVTPGTGLAALFAGEGVEVVTGDDIGPAEVVEAVIATGAREVVLLPNDAEIAALADLAAGELRTRDVRVVVIPTRSPVQGLAAVAVHDISRRFDDDVVAMAEAAAATRFAEVSVAEYESLTSAGICQAGDILGLIDGEVVDIGHGVLSVALAVVDRLLGVGAELMTVLIGAEAQPGLGEVVRHHVRDRTALTEVTVYDAGQLGRPLIIGVE